MHPPESRSASQCAHPNCRAAPSVVVTVAMVDELGWLCAELRPGAQVCLSHKPRACYHCGALIPWFDGSICDHCDRYTDEDGGCCD